MTTRKANSYEARFLCPLSGELMKDPVVDADGNSYEHVNIIVWLDDRGKSPLTGRVMKKDELKPNHILKDTIEHSLKEQRVKNARQDASSGWQFGTNEGTENSTEGLLPKKTSPDKIFDWLTSRSTTGKTAIRTGNNGNSSQNSSRIAHFNDNTAEKKEKHVGNVRFADKSGGNAEQLFDIESNSSFDSNDRQSSTASNSRKGIHSGLNDIGNRGARSARNMDAGQRAGVALPGSGKITFGSSSKKDLGGSRATGGSSVVVDAPVWNTYKSHAIVDNETSAGSIEENRSGVASAEESSRGGRDREHISLSPPPLDNIPSPEDGKMKKKKKSKVKTPTGDFHGVPLSHSEEGDENAPKKRVKKMKRNKEGTSSSSSSSVGSTGKSFGSHRSIDSRSGSQESAVRPTPTSRELDSAGLPGVLEASDGDQRDICTKAVTYVLISVFCPLEPLHVSLKAKDFPLRYWNVYITAAELFDSSLLRAWQLDHICLCCSALCGNEAENHKETTESSHKRLPNSYGTAQVDGEILVGGKRKPPMGLYEHLYAFVRRCCNSWSTNTINVNSNNCSDTTIYISNGDEKVERDLDDLVTGLTGLACAWLQLHTLVAVLCWYCQDFSLSLRTSLDSTWLLRLLIPTAGNIVSVYDNIEAVAAASGSSLSTSQMSAVKSLQAALSFQSLSDSVPGTLLLFCLGYTLVKTVKYTVLARWELLERTRTANRGKTQSTTAYSSHTPHATQEQHEGKEKMKKNDAEKQEEDDSSTTITYRGRVITLPKDIESGADFSALPSSAVRGKRKEANKHSDNGDGSNSSHTGTAGGGLVGTAGLSGASEAVRIPLSVPLPRAYKYMDLLLLLLLGGIVPSLYISCLFIAFLSSYSMSDEDRDGVLGSFQALFWSDSHLTWWTALVPVPLNNLTPLALASSSTMMQKFEETYASICDAILTTSSVPTFELGQFFIEGDLKTVLPGAELLVGLSVQSALATLLVIAILVWVEKSMTNARFSTSSSSFSNHGANPDGTGVWRSGTTGMLLSASSSRWDFIFSLFSIFKGNSSISSGDDEEGKDRIDKRRRDLLPGTLRVVGSLAMWRPMVLSLAGIIVITRVIVMFSDVVSSSTTSELLLSSYSGVEGSPLVSNSRWLGRVALVPWFRVDACLLGLLFYLTHVPGGLSLKTKRKKQKTSALISKSDADHESSNSRENEASPHLLVAPNGFTGHLKGTSETLDEPDAYNSYRVALLYAYGSLEGDYNVPGAVAYPRKSHRETISDGSGEKLMQSPPRLLFPEDPFDSTLDSFNDNESINNRNKLHNRPDSPLAGANTATRAQLGRRPEQLRRHQRDSIVPAVTLSSLLGYHSESSFDSWDGSEYDKAYSAAIAAASNSVVSLHENGNAGGSDNASSHLQIVGKGNNLYDDDDEIHTVETLKSIDDAWYEKNPYKVGDKVEVKRTDLIKQERARERATGISKQDELDGVRGGVMAPEGVRFAPIVASRKFDRERSEERAGRRGRGSRLKDKGKALQSWLAPITSLSWILSGKENANDSGSDCSSNSSSSGEEDEEKGLLPTSDGRRGRTATRGSITEVHSTISNQHSLQPRLMYQKRHEGTRQKDLRQRASWLGASAMVVLLGVWHTLSTQSSVWLTGSLRLFGLANASTLDSGLIAEYAYRCITLFIAPLACFGCAHLAAEQGWFNPLYFPVSIVVARNPMFMLLGKVAFPFLLVHTLVTCAVLNGNGLTGNLSYLQETTTTVTFFSQQEVTNTAYTVSWTGNVGNLFTLYMIVLPISLATAVLLSMAVLQPVMRYCRDRLMGEFSIAKQWRDLL